jgi:hypothetical protein
MRVGQPPSPALSRAEGALRGAKLRNYSVPLIHVNNYFLRLPIDNHP